MQKPIILILSASNNNIIGINNNIPWNIKNDMMRFKYYTTIGNIVNDDIMINNIMDKEESNTISNVVIMGRKTFNSINNKPLKNRLNIVITSKYEQMENNENLIFLSNIKNAIYYANLLPNINNIWIIGGSSLFNDIKQINYQYIMLTKILKNIDMPTNNSDCSILSNIFFDEINMNTNIIYQSKHTCLESNIDYEFINYKQKNNIITTNQEQNKNNYEIPYLNLLKNILISGDFRKTRNGFTWSDFGSQLIFDTKFGFPLLTSKKISLRIIFEELMFFIRGLTDNKILKNKNIHIWDGNTTEEFIKNNNIKHENGQLIEENDMGPIYGFQFRHFNAQYDRPNNIENEKYYSNKGVDQLKKVISDLQNNPFSRRILMTSYNPVQAENAVLYPCHSIVIQFYAKSSINNTLKISVKMYQRSADLFLGLPFNIASTALLLYIVCDYLNINTNQNKYVYEPDNVILTIGDTHIYQSHIDAVLTQLQSTVYNFPSLKINHNKEIKNIEDYEFDNIELTDYKAEKIIRAKMIV